MKAQLATAASRLPGAGAGLPAPPKNKLLVESGSVPISIESSI